MDYKSVDSVLEENQAVRYPTDLLNSLEPPGNPPHKLFLKVGVLIMLLRNINPPKLYNGIRLIVKTLSLNVIEATITTGCTSGEQVFNPRIAIKLTDTLFELRRIQFPGRLSITIINKAECQTFKSIGLYLIEPCFSHGQHYVGCSRVSSLSDLLVNAANQKPLSNPLNNSS
uniref:DNA helicase Pif1-like 2B domain-containing protein n=1 Tax=Octopus bimaculoides TaxID=37653 RepID=A0A0L8HEU4_OCTBM